MLLENFIQICKKNTDIFDKNTFDSFIANIIDRPKLGKLETERCEGEIEEA